MPRTECLRRDIPVASAAGGSGAGGPPNRRPRHPRYRPACWRRATDRARVRASGPTGATPAGRLTPPAALARVLGGEPVAIGRRLFVAGDRQELPGVIHFARIVLDDAGWRMSAVHTMTVTAVLIALREGSATLPLSDGAADDGHPVPTDLVLKTA